MLTTEETGKALGAMLGEAMDAGPPADLMQMDRSPEVVETMADELLYRRKVYPRRRVKQPGMTGKRFEAARAKGFVDLSLVNPKNAKGLSIARLAEHLWMAMGGRDDKRGVAYLKDPQDILGVTGTTPEKLGKAVKHEVWAYFQEESGLAGEREEWGTQQMYHLAADMAWNAQVSVTKVKGRDGSPGYRIVLSPSTTQMLANAKRAVEQGQR